MESLQIVSGFSELKDLLIRTYQVTKNKEFIRLYFTELDNELLMHDYADHKKVIVLSRNIDAQNISVEIPVRARRLIRESFMRKGASDFLNRGFQLHGFFRS